MGLQMVSLVQLLQIGARKSSDVDLVCNFPHIEHEQLEVWSEFM